MYITGWFLKEGTQNPKIINNYIDEIRENNELLATFLFQEDIANYNIDDWSRSFHVTVYLEPGIHNIQLCQNGKVIRDVQVDPAKTREIRPILPDMTRLCPEVDELPPFRLW